MIAITIPQPLCQMVAAGAIRYVLRPKGTEHRGPVSLHAATLWPAEVATKNYAADLKRLGFSQAAMLPRNSIIGTGDLIRVIPYREWELPASQKADFLITQGANPDWFVYQFTSCSPDPVEVILTNDPGSRWVAWTYDADPFFAGTTSATAKEEVK